MRFLLYFSSIFTLYSCMMVSLAACGPNAPEQTPAIEGTDSMPKQTTTAETLDWWQPRAGLSWQWQLTGKLDLDLQTDVIDIDLNVGDSVVDYYHDKGTKAIYYISVGSYENWRTDADQFPDEVLGNKYEGWSGERWLDIRRIDLLAPIMLARLDECAAKDFDAVEPDNMEIYPVDIYETDENMDPEVRSNLYKITEEALKYTGDATRDLALFYRLKLATKK